MSRRVVITGIGIIAPNGTGKKSFFDAVVEGRSSVRAIHEFDTSGFKTRIISAADDFDGSLHGLTAEQMGRLDRYAQFAVAGANMAVQDAELNIGGIDHERMGVSIGNAICGTKLMEKEFVAVTDAGKKPIDPSLATAHLYQASMFNSPANEISAFYNTKGICITIPTGCTSGMDSLGFARECIVNGDVDVMITGAAEAPFTPITLAAFDVINCLSTRNDDPKRASRPYDKDRDGFVMAEGCGILVLEELEHALRRKAPIYAEIIGYATGCNAFHMTDLAPDGLELARVINIALNQAGVSPEDISYISAHGSSTKQNDRNETAALKRSLGACAYRIPISSLKSMIGHPLAAANSVEIIAMLLGMQHNVMHPTINYETPDPECDLDYIPNQAREGKVETVLKVASGFSGIHSAMVIRKYH